MLTPRASHLAKTIFCWLPPESVRQAHRRAGRLDAELRHPFDGEGAAPPRRDQSEQAKRDLPEVGEGEVPVDGIGADDAGDAPLGGDKADAVADGVAPRARPERRAAYGHLARRLGFGAGHDPRQRRLARAEHAGDAEDLALAKIERDAAEVARLGDGVRLEHDLVGRHALRRLAIIFGVPLAADDQLMQPDLVDVADRALVDHRAVLERDDLVAGGEDIGEAMRDEHEGGAGAPAAHAVEQLLGLVVGKGAGRLVEQDDRLDRIDAAQRKSLGDLDELALAEGQVAGQRRRADLDAKLGEHFAGLADHRPLAKRAGNDEFPLAAEEDVLVDGDGRDQALLPGKPSRPRDAPPRPGDRSRRDTPPIAIVPVSGRTVPLMTERSVDFPAPFSPTRPRICRRRKTRLTPASARVPG